MPSEISVTKVAGLWQMQILIEFLGLTLKIQITDNEALCETDLTGRRKIIPGPGL